MASSSFNNSSTQLLVIARETIRDFPETKHDEMFHQVQQEEQIKPKPINPKTKKSEFQIEAVTPFRLAVLTLYIACLLVIIHLRVDFPLHVIANKSLSRYYLNQVRVGSSYIVSNKSKPYLDNINDLLDISSFISSTLIYGLYQNDDAEIVEENTPNGGVMIYEAISSLNIIQKRAQIISQPENKHFPSRWNTDYSLENTTQYGTSRFPIYYSPDQGGFNLTIQVQFQSYKSAMRLLNEALRSGYFDEQTREVDLYFGVYSNINKLVTYFSINFVFSPTGRAVKLSSIESFPLTFYGDSQIYALPFQIIFFLLFVYYFMQEFVKICNRVKNLSPKDNHVEKDESALSHVTKLGPRIIKKLILISKGLLNHLKDPWTFLDMISLVCSLADIIIWLYLLKQDAVQNYLNSQGYLSALSYEEKQKALYDFDPVLKNVVTLNVLFRQFAACNMLVLLVKFVKYMTVLNDRVKDQVQILIGVTNQIMPFVVLVITILIAYTYMMYLTYGDSIEELSNYFSTFRYLLTNVHNNFDNMVTMWKINSGYTFMIHIALIFVVNFILVSMFFVYVSHGFKYYVQQKSLKEKEALTTKGVYHFQPHFVWEISRFFKRELPLLFLKRLNIQRFFTQKKLYETKDQEEAQDLARYPNFDFDNVIQTYNHVSENFDPIFSTEDAIRKAKRERKINRIKLLWFIILIWIGFFFLTLVSLHHHQVSQAQSDTGNIKFLLNQDDIRVMQDNKTISSYGIGKRVKNLETMFEVGFWLYLLFPMFPKAKNITLKGDKTFNGYFFAGDSLLLGDTFRTSTRIRTEVELEAEEYHGINSRTLSPVFKADAIDPPGESKRNIRGNLSNLTYSYTPNVGYKMAGGYIFEMPAKMFSPLMTLAAGDNFFDYHTNSLVIDFGLYNIKSKNVMYAAIIFEMNEGSYFDVTLDIDYVSLNYYSDSYDLFIGVVEVVIAIWTLVFTFKVFSQVRTNQRNYNFWHMLFIANLPRVVRMQREKKEPEFIRKFKYVFNFDTLINIGILLFLYVSIALWIAYVVNIAITRQAIDYYINKPANVLSTPIQNFVNRLELDFSIIFTLKITESIVLVLLTIKILYCYSFLPKFKFLTKTIKRSLKWAPHMFFILILVLLAFGFFLRFIRGNNDPKFSSIWRMLTEQAQNLKRIETEDKIIFTENYANLMTLVYFFPWVFFAACIVSNMFLGIMLSAYNSFEDIKDEEVITLKDFLKTTVDIIKDRNKPKPTGSRFEVSKQVLDKIDSQKVFQAFDNVVYTGSHFKDPELWAVACSKNIIDENEHRKLMKQISKQIRKGTALDFDFNNNRHQKVLTDEEKSSQFAFRLKYWKYFKYANKQLVEYSGLFNYAVKYNNQYMDERTTRSKNKVENRIKEYIFKLENQVNGNLREIQGIKRALDEYTRETQLTGMKTELDI